MEKMLDLIGEIYEASFNPGHWNAAITTLCEYLQARSGALFIEDHSAGTRGMIGAHGLSGAVRLSYRLGMSKHGHTFQLQHAQPWARPDSWWNPVSFAANIRFITD